MFSLDWLLCALPCSVTVAARVSLDLRLGALLPSRADLVAGMNQQ